MKTAYASPTIVDTVGAMSTQTMVFTTVRIPSGWVKIQTKLSRPTNWFPAAFMNEATKVWIDGRIRPISSNSAAGVMKAMSWMK